MDAYCWGWNFHGQLGAGMVTIQEPTPLQVTGGHTFQSVSAARNHSCGVTTAGDVYCWGLNIYGQLGDDTFITKYLPVFLLDFDPGMP